MLTKIIPTLNLSNYDKNTQRLDDENNRNTKNKLKKEFFFLQHKLKDDPKGNSPELQYRIKQKHGVKSVHIRSYCGPQLFRIQTEYGDIPGKCGRE